MHPENFARVPAAAGGRPAAGVRAAAPARTDRADAPGGGGGAPRHPPWGVARLCGRETHGVGYHPSRAAFLLSRRSDRARSARVEAPPALRVTQVRERRRARG